MMPGCGAVVSAPGPSLASGLPRTLEQVLRGNSRALGERNSINNMYLNCTETVVPHYTCGGASISVQCCVISPCC